jgi:hypothetical protein
VKKTLLKWKAQFTGSLRSVPEKVVAGAAGALGAALIAAAPIIISWALGVWSGERAVGILSQPNQPNDTSPVASNGPACAQQAASTPVQLSTGSNFEIEFWNVRKTGNALKASIANEEGMGHGQVYGFQKLRDGSTHVDTIFAGFDGASLGKGYYALERGMKSGVKESWWKGTHSYYDCTTGITFKCPYLLGPETSRKDMSLDPWLTKPCVLETLPSNEARFPSDRSREAQLEKNYQSN